MVGKLAIGDMAATMQVAHSLSDACKLRISSAQVGTHLASAVNDSQMGCALHNLLQNQLCVCPMIFKLMQENVPLQHRDIVKASHVHEEMHTQNPASCIADLSRALDLGSGLAANTAAATLSSAASAAELLLALLPVPLALLIATNSKSLSVTNIVGSAGSKPS